MPLGRPFVLSLAALGIAVAGHLAVVEKNNTDLFNLRGKKYLAMNGFRDPVAQNNFAAFLSKCASDFTGRVVVFSFSNFVVDDATLAKNNPTFTKISAHNFSSAWTHRYDYTNALYSLSVNDRVIMDLQIKAPGSADEVLWGGISNPNRLLGWDSETHQWWEDRLHAATDVCAGKIDLKSNKPTLAGWSEPAHSSSPAPT